MTLTVCECEKFQKSRESQTTGGPSLWLSAQNLRFSQNNGVTCILALFQ
eukprot:COSAG02_NODE_32453_length_516_cov_0.621103_1_plen_48_part_10